MFLEMEVLVAMMVKLGPKTHVPPPFASYEERMIAFALRQNEFSYRLDGTEDQLDAIYCMMSSLNTFHLYTHLDTYTDLEVEISRRRQ